MNLFSRLMILRHTILSRSLKISGLATAVASTALLWPAWQCGAQTLPSSAPVSAPASAPARPDSPKPPTLPSPFTTLEWRALTPAQQLSLKPLAGSWASLSDGQKRKWISLSANFAQMNSDEQGRLHTRMVQWAALSNKQREQARLNFAETKSIAPGQKNEHWQAYQALSNEEKQQLAKSAPPKPPRTALAAQPAASGKLSQVPTKTNAPNAIIAASSPQMANSKTLLARPVPPKPPVSAASDVSGKP